jgi:hypothetical protein
MNRKIIIFAITIIACLVATETKAAYVFENDDPSFITLGKVVRPSQAPISVTYYASGRVQAERFQTNTAAYPLDTYIELTYKDEKGKKVGGKSYGRVDSVQVKVNPGLYQNYAITYYGNSDRIQSVTMTDGPWGNKEVWNYNKNGTLKSSDLYYTTGMNFGHTMLQTNHIDYTYKPVKGGKIEATQTTTNYVYTFVYQGEGQYKPVLKGTTTTTETFIFSRKNLRQLYGDIFKGSSTASDFKEWIEKQDVLSTISKNKEALGNIKITGDVVTKVPQAIGPIVNNGKGSK